MQSAKKKLSYLILLPFYHVASCLKRQRHFQVPYSGLVNGRTWSKKTLLVLLQAVIQALVCKEETQYMKAPDSTTLNLTR